MTSGNEVGIVYQDHIVLILEGPDNANILGILQAKTGPSE
jgi:hypothetical protein